MAEYTIDKIEYGGNVYKLQDTDEKLKVEAVSASEATSYFPIVSAFSATDAAVRQRDTTGFEYEVFSGTTSSQGAAGIRLGNKTATGTAGNKKGFITIYGTGANCSTLYGPSGGSADYNVWFPNNGGTLALTTDITDEKVAVGGITSGSTYYPIVGSGTAAATRQIDTTGFSYDATTSTTGYARITLGNSTAQPTSGSKYGSLRLYGTTANSTTIVSGAPTAMRTITLPDKTGTVALTDDIPTFPSNNVTGSGTVNYLARWSGTNTLSSTSLYISTSYNNNSDSYGTIKLYVGSTGQVDWKGQLVFHDGSSSKTITITPPSLTASRTLTLPDKTGTIALTSDLPTVPSNIVNTITTTAGTHTAITSQKGDVSFKVPTKTSHLTNDSGFITSAGVTSITTTAGAHTAITSSTGAVSFKVPTKTSHLTNDSGFITTDTNTTYALSGALSSHKFTSTLTAGGSGSGTSTSDFTLAAGTGITITDDTSNRKMTIACSVTNTDKRLEVNEATSGIFYYPILSTGTTVAETRSQDTTGFSFLGVSGTGTASGTATFTIGNNSTGGSGKYGKLTIYSASEYSATLQTGSAFTANRTFSLPDKSGYIALTSDLSNYMTLPSNTDYANYGWVLSYGNGWVSTSAFQIAVQPNYDEHGDPDGTYFCWNYELIRDAFFEGRTLELHIDLPSSSNETVTHVLTDYYFKEILYSDESACYQIIEFTGIIKEIGVSQKKITCRIYLDENEEVHTNGEVTVDIKEIDDEKAYFYVNTLTSVTISSTSTPIKLPINGMLSGVGFTYDSTNKGIVCNKTSKYAISAQIGLDTATSGDLIGIHIYKDGTSIVGPSYHRVGGNYDCALLLPTIITMEKDSVYTVYIRNNTNSRGKTSTGVRISCWEV